MTLELFFVSYYIGKAEDDSALCQVCVRRSNLIIEAGYTKGLSLLKMNDKVQLMRTLMSYYTVLRSRSVLNQLAEGLSVPGCYKALSWSHCLSEASKSHLLLVRILILCMSDNNCSNVCCRYAQERNWQSLFFGARDTRINKREGNVQDVSRFAVQD